MHDMQYPPFWSFYWNIIMHFFLFRGYCFVQLSCASENYHEKWYICLSHRSGNKVSCMILSVLFVRGIFIMHDTLLVLSIQKIIMHDMFPLICLHLIRPIPNNSRRKLPGKRRIPPGKRRNSPDIGFIHSKCMIFVWYARLWIVCNTCYIHGVFSSFPRSSHPTPINICRSQHCGDFCLPMIPETSENLLQNILEYKCIGAVKGKTDSVDVWVRRVGWVGW